MHALRETMAEGRAAFLCVIGLPAIQTIRHARPSQRKALEFKMAVTKSAIRDLKMPRFETQFLSYFDARMAC